MKRRRDDKEHVDKPTNKKRTRRGRQPPSSLRHVDPGQLVYWGKNPFNINIHDHGSSAPHTHPSASSTSAVADSPSLVHHRSTTVSAPTTDTASGSRANASTHSLSPISGDHGANTSQSHSPSSSYRVPIPTADSISHHGTSLAEDVDSRGKYSDFQTPSLRYSSHDSSTSGTMHMPDSPFNQVDRHVFVQPLASAAYSYTPAPTSYEDNQLDAARRDAAWYDLLHTSRRSRHRPPIVQRRALNTHHHRQNDNSSFASSSYLGASSFHGQSQSRASYSSVTLEQPLVQHDYHHGQIHATVHEQPASPTGEQDQHSRASADMSGPIWNAHPGFDWMYLDSQLFQMLLTAHSTPHCLVMDTIPI
ncbi:hypothetical protein C8Q76DRAFT_690966 [Earliella scabrosa]|nr:hypothetical protein C8Q76DRAFT_690966 [Earliella scabrosa]